MSSEDGETPNKQNIIAKSSPSILVTDARSNKISSVRAPFAGQRYRTQEGKRPPGLMPGLWENRLSRANKYNDVSIDKLLSNSSDIPSGQSRLPALIGSKYGTNRLQKQGGGSRMSDMGHVNLKYLRRGGFEKGSLRKNISNPKISQSLPSRTSKTSQKLVLIPESQRGGVTQGGSPPPTMKQTSWGVDPSAPIQRSRAELMPKEARAHEFSRMTAYFICDEFNLPVLSNYLKNVHEVKPRLYDEALYIPYSLPLLPGLDGFRVKSNNSLKLLANKRYVEKMINKSEQTDHLYEYYSGFETPEDANNYSMDPELEQSDNSTPFDPSEPQYFAPPMRDSEREEEYDLHHESSNSEESKTNGENDATKETSPGESSMSQIELSKHHAEMFIFAYGIVVFWNFSEIHEKNILADLAFADCPEPLIINPISDQDIETEEFHFEYDEAVQRPRIYNDMITLRSGDHLIKLTMSHAIAQLTKLCLFESQMVNILQLISRLPKKLALTGELGLKRQQLLKKSGKLFKLRVEVNLSSSILDTPDFFWSFEPALHPLYNAVREYLEIDQRVQVINDRCKVFLEFLDIMSDSIYESNSKRITWMIIIIIFLSLLVSTFEFFLEFI